MTRNKRLVVHDAHEKYHAVIVNDTHTAAIADVGVADDEAVAGQLNTVPRIHDPPVEASRPHPPTVAASQLHQATWLATRYQQIAGRGDRQAVRLPRHRPLADVGAEDALQSGGEAGRKLTSEYATSVRVGQVQALPARTRRQVTVGGCTKSRHVETTQKLIVVGVIDGDLMVKSVQKHV